MLNDQTNKKRNIRFCIHKKKFCQDDKLKFMAKSTLLVLAKTITWVKLRNLNLTQTAKSVAINHSIGTYSEIQKSNISYINQARLNA